MRSVKSLISGFGVAISLVGAVACAFFITAALVAFNGSFEVSASPGPQSGVLTASVKRERPIVIAVRAPSTTTTVTRPVEPASSPVVERTVAPIVKGPASTTVAQPPATPKPPVSTPAAAPATKPASTTAPLANATAGLTQAVGTVVDNATGSLATTVAPISPALSGVLQGLGTGLANVVVSLGNTVAGVVTALGGPAPTPQG